MSAEQNSLVPATKQKGIVLLLIVLVLLGIGGTMLLVGIGAGVQSNERRLAKAAEGSDELTRAKLALIGFVASPSDHYFRPGVLPTPDSLANGIYDGKSDTTCLSNGTNGLPAAGGSSLNKRCLGKFPWVDLSFDVGSPAADDPTGGVPWLAISANLVNYDGCLKVLNSDSARLDSPAVAACPPLSLPYPQPATLPHPWLTVVDENGAVLSNRVAAVVILPGTAIATETRQQQRSPGAPGNPNSYLDDIKLPLGCTSGCTTYDNAGLNNTFISIRPGTRYPLNAQDASKRGQAVQFNDQIAYITIDELIPIMERRVAGQIGSAVKSVKANPNFAPSVFPWAAPFISTQAATTTLTSLEGAYFGAVPFMTDYQVGNNADYSTDFDWSLTGFTENLSTACRRISTGPNRYVKNTLSNAIAAPLATPNIASGSMPVTVSPPAKSVCQWKGTNRVSCGLVSGQVITSSFLKSLPIYSNNTCTTLVANSTLSISRSINTAIFDMLCPSPPTIAYTSADGTHVHRWLWTCSANSPAGITISLTATDTISNNGGTTYNQLPRTVTTSLGIPAAGAKQLTVSRMRYHPIMPSWFHENLWYTTAFYGVAPSVAPANSNPCGVGVSYFSSGSNQNVEVISILASSTILPATRPSASITDYLEGQNASSKGGAAPGISNCSFSPNGSAPTPTANDQLVIVSP